MPELPILALFLLTFLIVGSIEKFGFWPAVFFLAVGYALMVLMWQIAYGWPGFLAPLFLKTMLVWALAVLAGGALGVLFQKTDPLKRTKT